MEESSSRYKGAYERDGFLVLPRFVPHVDLVRLRLRAGEILQSSGIDEARSIFSTKNQLAKTDLHFLSSGDKIRCFFEEEAFDDQGELRQPLEQSINKLGHAMHDLDPVFGEFSRTPELASLSASLGFNNPVILQSMYIFKQPHIGGEVTCHQDGTFLFTEPMTVTGFWFALEDAAQLNGCLWAIPGGHKDGLKRRFIRNSSGGTEFVELDRTPWPMERLIPLEVEAGTLIVLHGLLPHMSHANRSDKSRHAYTFHVVEREAAYPAENWLQRSPSLTLRGFE